MKGGIRSLLARGGLALWLAFAPLLASAQAYTVNPEDTAFTKALNPVFGDVFGSGSGGGALDGAVGGLFSNLNAAVLLIAAIVTAYTIVAGTMATAHDGSMLGKKWSSMWIPIRTAFGIGMIIPISGGWCAAQLAVFWLVGQGVALASNGWAEYANTYLTPTEKLVAPVAGNAGYLANDMFKYLVCVESLNKLSGESATTGSVAQPGVITGSISATGGGRYYGTAGDPKMCGYIPFAGVSSSNEISKDIALKMGEAQAKATMQLESDLRPLAKSAVTDTTGTLDNSSAFREAINKYMATIDAAAADATGDGSKYAEASKAMNQKGFIYAGFRQINIYMAANTLSSGAQAVPAAGGGAATGTSGVNADIAGDMAKAEKSVWQSMKDGVSDATDWVVAKGKTIGEYTLGAIDTVRKVVTGEMSITNMVSNTSFAITQSVVENFKAGGSNPYASGINFGHTLMAVSETAAIGATAISVAVGLFLPVASAFWDSTGGAILKGLVVAVYGSGTALTLLPLVPLAFWLAFIGGWILMVAEAVIAAPLWMVAHLSPESEGFTGRGSNGYLLITGVVLRPILGLIGLALSFSIGTVLCNLLDEMYLPLLQSAAGHNMIGLGSLVAMIGAYVGLKYTILIQSFRSVNVLADSVMRWIGGGEAHGGAVAAGQAMAAGAEGHHAAMAGAITAAAQQGMSGRDGAQAIKDWKKERDAKKQEKLAQAEREKAKDSKDDPYGDGGDRRGGGGSVLGALMGKIGGHGGESRSEAGTSSNGGDSQNGADEGQPKPDKKDEGSNQ